MRVVDAGRLLLESFKAERTAHGYIEAVSGARYYISDAQSARHIMPAPSATEVAAKIVIML